MLYFLFYMYVCTLQYVPNMHAGSRSRLHELFDVGDVHSHGQHEKVKVCSRRWACLESLLCLRQAMKK